MKGSSCFDPFCDDRLVGGGRTFCNGWACLGGNRWGDGREMVPPVNKSSLSGKGIGLGSGVTSGVPLTWEALIMVKPFPSGLFALHSSQ